ncbi:MAG: 30S ribosomal protein S8 [Candidatus Aenigmarchaeota archaeon]|nr:30S ribosomal protein S8 [Candidatus Aenigmarchaeota archaeon]
MKHDSLADVFAIIKNTESVGKKECMVPASKLAADILRIMKDKNYIGRFERIEDGKGGKFRVTLIGNINNCHVVKPRFSTKNDEFIKWEKRFLPANNIGLLLVTTSKGVMDHQKAKKEGLGGQLLGYVY